MSRPRKPRRITGLFKTTIYTAAGANREVDPTFLSIPELETLRLADSLNYHHEDAAKMMEISRATFSRILEGARRKLAYALINQLPIVTEGNVS